MAKNIIKIYNPNKSWRKFKKENWSQYFCRQFTYNRLHLYFIAFFLLLGLILFLLTLCYKYTYNKERTSIRENIERNISKIESKLDRDVLMSKNDTTEHGKLITKFQLDILDYVDQWKAVANSKSSEDYANMPIKDVLDIMENENQRARDLNKYYTQLSVDIKSIRRYEYLTDTNSYTKLSEEKQIIIINYGAKQSSLDSISTKKIHKHLDQIKEDYQRKLNYRKELKRCVSEIKDMTYNLNWYYYHNAVMDFLVESNNLFEISKRKYQNIPPYKLLNDIWTESYPNDTTNKEIVKDFLIQILETRIWTNQQQGERR